MSNTEELKAKALNLYQKTFGSASTIIAAAAPGRVNLIGEHVDYSGGPVFPMAIQLETVIVGSANGTDRVVLTTESSSVEENKLAEFSLSEPLQRGLPKWANYMKGVIANFHANDGSRPSTIGVGFNAAIASNVPMGAGLSSSAALEVATHTFLEALTSADGKSTWSEDKLVNRAKNCQKAEHEFANVPCGIMDQFISAMGKEHHALLINCKTLSYRQVKFDNPNVQILVTDSRVSHSLDGSEYSVRRQQCEEALAAIQAKYSNVTCLAEATMVQLDAIKNEIDSVVYRRARHAIGECQRTLQAADALEAGDYVLFGKLMIQSHNSLRDDYEVSCPELDQIVEIALKCKGVYGSRMTGGGFGGCTVTLVDTDQVSNVIERIESEYPQGRSFSSSPAQGARLLQL